VVIREALAGLVNEGRSLSQAEAAAVMSEIMTGEATPAQLGAFLVALRLKGETVDEIAGMAQVMREHAVRVPIDGLVVDTAGTGGDGQGTFNVSTAAAFVAAAAGARVAKHGNRAVSSDCGSADILEALGAKIELSPEQVAHCIREVGFGFMFAPAFHPATRHAAGPRRELGLRTVFNILGPLTNPAGAQCQLMGVPQAGLAGQMAAVLQRLGCRHALVVHGYGGLDELSLSGPSTVHELREGVIREYDVFPENLGLEPAPTEAIRGGSPADNASALRAIFGGAQGPLRDVVLLNAAGALIAADLSEDFPQGLTLAGDALDGGEAGRRLERFVELTRSFA